MLRPGGGLLAATNGRDSLRHSPSEKRRAGRHQETDLDRLAVLLYARLAVGLFGQQARWRRSRSVVNNCFQYQFGFNWPELFVLDLAKV